MNNSPGHAAHVCVKSKMIMVSAFIMLAAGCGRPVDGLHNNQCSIPLTVSREAGGVKPKHGTAAVYTGDLVCVGFMDRVEDVAAEGRQATIRYKITSGTALDLRYLEVSSGSFKFIDTAPVANAVGRVTLNPGGDFGRVLTVKIELPRFSRFDVSGEVLPDFLGLTLDILLADESRAPEAP